MSDNNIKVWKSLSIEEKQKVASKRLKAQEEEHRKMVQSAENGLKRFVNNPEAVASLTKKQEEFARIWNSLDYQASEYMDDVNEAYYYSNIEPGYIPFAVSNIIKEIREEEDLAKVVQIIITKSKVSGKNEEQVKYITNVINSRIEAIIGDCDFGCEWYEAGCPDIYSPEDLTKWHNEDDFKDFIIHLIIIDDLKDYREKLNYPDEVLISQQSYNKRMETEAQKEKQVVLDKISNWVNTILTAARVEPKRIVDTNKYILSLINEGKIPGDIEPINEYYYQFKSADFRAFIWVVWYYAKDIKDIKKLDQELIVRFVHGLFPEAFQKVDSLNSTKQHLTDNIKGQDAIICGQEYEY